jgi:hypothetical protein
MIKSILAALSAIAFVGSLALAQEGAAPAPAAGGDKPAATAPAKKSAKKGKKKAKKTSSNATKSEATKG